MEVKALNDNDSAFHSSEYDEKISKTLPYYEEFYKQVTDFIRLYNPNPLSWLDIGCGTGKMAKIAFQNVNIKNFIFCDSSAEMIELAKKQFNSANVEFIVSKIQELKFRNKFDIITAIQVNHYLHQHERIAAIRNCYDALSLGGVFITFENFLPFTEIGTKLYLDRWNAYQLEHGKTKGECEKHRNRFNHNYFPISVTEQLRLMKNCGFKTVELLWLSYMQVGILGIK